MIQTAVGYGRLDPGAGAVAVAEDLLATTEAIQASLERLSPEGVLALSGNIDDRLVLRLAGMVRTALEARGIPNAPGCIFIAAEGGLASVLIRTTPFTPEELAALEWHCRDLGFRVLYEPDGAVDTPIAGLLSAPDAATFLAALPYDASPSGDDRPFFSFLIRPGDFLHSRAARALDAEDRGLLLLRNLLGGMLVAIILYIALPLAFRDLAREIQWRPAGAAVGYFAAIGLGFAIVEIGLFRRFQLLLGAPASLSAVTPAVFLAAAVLGSVRARLSAGNARLVRRSCARLTIVLLFTAVLLPPLREALLAMPLWVRLAATVAVAAPLGYLMGQPLPAGISLIHQERLIPWVWSINGALAAFGSIGVLLLAVNVGYTTAMLVGPACYLIAGVLAELVE